MKSNSGIGLIEIILGAAIVSAVFLALGSVSQYSLNLVRQSNYRLQATFLLSEGAEAVKLLRDQNWTSNIAGLTNGTPYYLTFSGGAWSITPTPQAKIGNIFDRTVVLAQVSRDSSDNIVSSGGTVDTNTRKITVRVSWSYRNQNFSESISSYITNLFNN